MSLLTVFLAVGAGLVSCTRFDHLRVRTAASVSNAGTSLTLLYQNNLNVTDNKNHVGALLLDAVPQSSASTACAALNEKLLPKATIQSYESDFLHGLSYQNYAGYYDVVGGFYIDNGTVTAGDQLTFSTSSSSNGSLPVLCTQSANGASLTAAPANGSQITVAAGTNNFVGYRNQKSFRFSGIPYADAPQRWKYSSVYSKKNQTIQATSYGAQCAQGSSGSEDCLFLNIQTPYIPKAGSTENLRPVLFWIHGGGFTGGSGADSLSDGGNLASREDIVTVTINYRLSTLGFLAIPGTDIKGNFGIADQITALDWVVANIASFGGNPRRITIMGESAGAGSVRTLLGSPQAIGKYQNAVSMSNLGGGVALGLSGDYGTTYSSYYTVNQSFAVAGPQIFAAAGCNSTSISAQIACLEQVPASQLVSLPTVARYVVQDGKYVNTEQLIVTTSSPNTAVIPVMFGVIRDDGASFSTYPKTPVANLSEGLQVSLGINSTWAQNIIDSGLFPYYDTGNVTLDSFNVSARIATDKTFRCIDQATIFAGGQSHAFQRAYFYQVERTINGFDPNNLGGPKDNDPNNPYFRFHGSDMPWVFGTLSTIRDPADLFSEQLVSGYFASFVKSGQPNPDEPYLKARGYDKTLEGVNKAGPWQQISGRDGPVQFLDWPSSQQTFVDVPQCEWLGYGLDYYFNGGI